MPEVPLEVSVNPGSTGLIEGAICFETGLTRAQVSDPELYAYDHHGSEYTSVDPGALSSFYGDVLLGRPMPTKFITRGLSADTVVAITLFLHRDLITHPRTLRVVQSIDFCHRLGPQGMAHVEDDVLNLFSIVGDMIQPTDRVLTKQEEAANLKICVGWVADLIHQVSSVPERTSVPYPQIKDVGTNGFVVAESPKSTPLGWVRLYQQGYLRGVLYTPETDGKRLVVASRKSVFVPFDLTKAASILSEVETAATGQHTVWYANELWLFCPFRGTNLKIEDIMEVLLRV